MTIKLLHFADLHVGMENYGKLDPQTGTSSRIRDFLDRLDEVVAYALAHEADLVIFAGDAFKTRDPDPTQQREFARRIKNLADKIPTFMLVGNHDIPGMAARATSIDIFRALEVPNIIIGKGISSQVVETRRGPVFLGWVPFPVRNRLISQEEHKGASVEELDRAVESLITSELQELAQQAAEHDMPRVLVGHFSVGGATFGSERSVMLGRDLVVPKSALADPAWDYVALGHIHKHQNLANGTQPKPPIVYSGSLERIDFGEEREDKGFCWIDLKRDQTEWQFVRVQARPFRTVRVDVREASDPTAAVIAELQQRELEGAIVRLQIQLGEAQEAALRLREIETVLSQVASSASISKEVEREARIANLGPTPEALSPLQWIEHYFLSKNKSPERAKQLLQAAQTLLGEHG